MPEKWERCVEKVKSKQSVECIRNKYKERMYNGRPCYNPYAICARLRKPSEDSKHKKKSKKASKKSKKRSRKSKRKSRSKKSKKRSRKSKRKSKKRRSKKSKKRSRKSKRKSKKQRSKKRSRKSKRKSKKRRSKKSKKRSRKSKRKSNRISSSKKSFVKIPGAKYDKGGKTFSVRLKQPNGYTRVMVDIFSDLPKNTVHSLRDVGKFLKIKNFSKMKKKVLIESIKKKSKK